MELLTAITQRSSVKEFDPTVKIPREQLTEMLALAQKAPSSLNLQPWRFVVVESEEAKAKLRGLMMFNETQRETAAALVLVLADLQHFDYADAILSQNVAQGVMPEEIKQNYLQVIQGFAETLSPQTIREQALMDSNLAAMQFMLIAKAYGYDTNPIGGFDHQKVLEVLEINAMRYLPVMFIAIGKAAKPPFGSSRLPIAKTIAWNSGHTLD